MLGRVDFCGGGSSGQRTSGVGWSGVESGVKCGEEMGGRTIICGRKISGVGCLARGGRFLEICPGVCWASQVGHVSGMSDLENPRSRCAALLRDIGFLQGELGWISHKR